MKFTLSFLSLACLLASGSTVAQTNWGGVITSDVTLTAAQSPYIVTMNTLIMENVTLTIEPGVELQFNDSLRLQVNGTIRAIGTEQDSIVFTRRAGSSTGWGGIHIHPTSEDYDPVDGSGCILAYAQIKHTVYAQVSNTSTYPIMCFESSPLFDHCEISCYEYLMYFVESSAQLRNCHFHHGQMLFQIENQSMANTTTFDSCYFHDFQYPPNDVLPGATCYGPSRIINCVFSDNEHNLLMRIATDDVQLTGNTFENNKMVLALLGGSQPSIQITGNRFSGNDVNLLISSCERHPQIYDNDFMDYTQQHVLVSQYYYPYLNYDCPPTGTVYEMDLQNNYWGGLDSAGIAASIYDFNDNFLEAVAIDFSGYAAMPFEANNTAAASLPQNIHCNGTDGLNELAALPFSIWPNPAAPGEVQLSVDNGTDCMVLAQTIEGKQVCKTVAEGGVLVLDTHDWAPGTYLVTVIAGTARSTKRLVVR